MPEVLHDLIGFPGVVDFELKTTVRFENDLLRPFYNMQVENACILKSSETFAEEILELPYKYHEFAEEVKETGLTLCEITFSSIDAIKAKYEITSSKSLIQSLLKKYYRKNLEITPEETTVYQEDEETKLQKLIDIVSK